MHTWKTHLIETLNRLRNERADASLQEAQCWLCSILEAQTLTFLGPDGSALPPDTTLAELLARPFSVDLRVSCASGGAETSLRADSGESDTCASDSRFRVGDAPAVGDGSSCSARFAHFVRDFDRLERKRGFMWAGYIVRELLPRLGFPLAEAKVVLDRLRADGVLTVDKVENPRNPEFPATAVHLNREHPQVQEVLASSSFDLPTTHAAFISTADSGHEGSD